MGSDDVPSRWAGWETRVLLDDDRQSDPSQTREAHPPRPPRPVPHPRDGFRSTDDSRTGWSSEGNDD